MGQVLNHAHVGLQNPFLQSARTGSNASNDKDKKGPSGKPVKSNLTDPDSAKMKTSKSIIQGDNGVAAVDDKHQVIVAAEVSGDAQQHHLLNPMIEAIRATFRAIGHGADIINDKAIKLTADSGFHTNVCFTDLEDNSIDAYVADNRFRSRDPRFQDAAKHKPKKAPPKLFTPGDFQVDLTHMTCRCPTGNALYPTNRNEQMQVRKAINFMGTKRDCGPCALRARCLRNPKQKTPPHVYLHRRANQRSL